ncbi:hypothetical protein UVI_02003150 [Ustilaginoidea virens]|uniref:N-acetylglucosaminylphosphatidylinositol deacetylase n=1 Tax=Ustilaginoidea virens TaxID=1159556 RepID=A0A1B5L270_USTVR|nr:hypothetical protein UVI_02003150 [Ustilaginoidea virens]
MLPALGLLAALAVVIPALYTYAVRAAQTRLPALRNKRICLLIAHPDDEAMFFAPTVLALTRDADGLGEVRKKELVKSGLHLGLRDADDVFIVDNPADFPDSMTQAWDEGKISDLLRSAFAPQLGRPAGDAAAPPSASIDVLVTFDAAGVSAHPNHVALYHGARAFVRALARRRACPLALYTLTSVGLLRKYAGLLDVFATLGAWAAAAAAAAVQPQHPLDAAHPPRLVLMNRLVDRPGLPGLPTAWRAMTRAHTSQMVWFRYLWIGLSRYMLINDLRLENVDGQ